MKRYATFARYANMHKPTLLRRYGRCTTRMLVMVAASSVLSSCIARNITSANPSNLEAPSRGALIEFRMAHLSPAEGRTAVELDGTRLYLDPVVLLSDPDFAFVRPTVGDGVVLLELEFTAAGAARLTQITGANIGRRMAFIFDSNIVSAPIINQAVGSPLVGRLPTQNAEAVAQRIRSRWPQRKT